MKESTVVRDISRQLRHAKRFFVNNHGTIMSQSGVPDFITMDETTRFLAIEAKAPGQKPRVNQMRRALEILKSGRSEERRVGKECKAGAWARNEMTAG